MLRETYVSVSVSCPLSLSLHPAFVQGDVVKVKASKIVAGQEVERTNEFLQLLSIAILKKVCTIQRFTAVTTTTTTYIYIYI